jgi:hypothetical protein
LRDISFFWLGAIIILLQSLLGSVQHFFDKGCFITLGSNYIQHLHNQDAHSRFVVSSKKKIYKEN